MSTIRAVLIALAAVLATPVVLTACPPVAIQSQSFCQQSFVQPQVYAAPVAYQAVQVPIVYQQAYAVPLVQSYAVPIVQQQIIRQPVIFRRPLFPIFRRAVRVNVVAPGVAVQVGY